MRESMWSAQQSLLSRWRAVAMAAVTVALTSTAAAFSFVPPQLSRSLTRPAPVIRVTAGDVDEESISADAEKAQTSASRRGFLASATAVSACGVLQLAPLASATTDGGGDSEGVSPKDMLARMRPVPTFAVVDGTTGTPYMIADKQGGGATGYFFTSFQGALFVLEEAKRVAEKEGYPEVWENAKIATVPLDIAMRLALKKINRKGQNDMKMDTICDIIASAESIDAALKYDTSGRYKQQGSVPLFYIDGLELPPGEGGEKRTPFYFSKSDLVAEWNKQNAGDASPQVKVVDLIDTFRAVMKPGGSNSEVLKSLVFVPTAETVKVARELKSKESVPQYKMNEMLAVGGK